MGSMRCGQGIGLNGQWDHQKKRQRLNTGKAYPERLLWLYTVFDEDIPELVCIAEVPFGNGPEGVYLRE